MTLLLVYLWLSTLMFLFLGTIWTRSSFVNVIIKLAFWILTVLGALLLLTNSGIVLSPNIRLI